jgi:hypothetical protein
LGKLSCSGTYGWESGQRVDACRLHLVGLVGSYPTRRYVSAHVSTID